MVRADEPGYWLCMRCDKEVSEHHLEAHMDSNKHQRYKSWYDQRTSLQERYERGELPDWMTVVDGEEFCKICDTRATEAHVYSHKHQKALAWHESSGSTNQCVTSYCEMAHMTSVVVPSFSTPHPIPANWGNPNHYEWKAEEGRYFCRLCWKYADDSHVESEKHTTREQYPEHYLGMDPSFSSSGLSGGAPPPPPPPPRPSHFGATPNFRSQVPAPPPRPERLALCFSESEPVHNQVACDPLPFMGDDHVVASASSAPGRSLEAVKEKDPAMPQHLSPRWERFAMDETQKSFWWWCEANGDSFVEDHPNGWIKYTDPQSGKSYWWFDDEKWFWVHSGSRNFQGAS